MVTNSTLLFPRSHWDVLSQWLVTAALSVVCLFGLADDTHGEASMRPHPFAMLQRRLIGDGFDPSLIQAIYARPEVTLDEKGLTAYFLHREATLDYDQFLTQSSVDQAIVYLKEHGAALQHAQELYGVEAEVVTAILLVESRLGTFVSKRLVLNTLSSLAALDETAKRDTLWRTYIKERSPTSKDHFEAWASRKSAWAYRELQAYIQYVQAQKVDPVSVYGSYAGALGFAQFIPSSILKFGRDGDKDGQINLYDHVDAIESVANYLKQHGWRPGLNRDEAFRVLLSYNHSSYYVDTILKVAERLSRLRPRGKTKESEVSG
jgi:membrane-bound lytic murein transglycosylase B